MEETSVETLAKFLDVVPFSTDSSTERRYLAHRLLEHFAVIERAPVDDNTAKSPCGPECGCPDAPKACAESEPMCDPRDCPGEAAEPDGDAGEQSAPVQLNVHINGVALAAQIQRQLDEEVRDHNDTILESVKMAQEIKRLKEQLAATCEHRNAVIDHLGLEKRITGRLEQELAAEREARHIAARQQEAMSRELRDLRVRLRRAGELPRGPFG